MKTLKIETNSNNIHKIDQKITFVKGAKFAIVYADYYERYPKFFKKAERFIKAWEKSKGYSKEGVSCDGWRLDVQCGEIIYKR